MTDSLSRRRLLAYRMLASGLARTTAKVADLPIWDIGLQDRDGWAALALAARVPRPELDRWLGGRQLGEPAAGTTFALVWSLRGSPHLHRRRDLQAVADALWPADEKDALARLVGSGKTLVANGSTGLDGYRVVAAAMRAVVTGTMRKPAASAALTAALPSEFSAFCRPCGSVHVMEMLFRCAALPGGLGLIPEQSATLQPLRETIKQPTVQTGLDRLITAYLQLYGAATPSEVGAHLGTTAAQIKRSWPDTEAITIDGTTLQATPVDADAVRATDIEATADIVRLLPPGDPLLQPRERALLIEDKAAWKMLWPAIGPAGAVVAGGAIAAAWRPKKVGSKLTINITEFEPLTAEQRSSVETEAELMAAVRRVDAVQVSFG